MAIKPDVSVLRPQRPSISVHDLGLPFTNTRPTSTRRGPDPAALDGGRIPRGPSYFPAQNSGVEL